MKRSIASLGFLLLACHVALGSAGAVFLCLCFDQHAHASPCAPSDNASGTAACAHDEAEPSVGLQVAPSEEACGDLLLVGSDIEALDRAKELLKLKASLASSAHFPEAYRVPRARFALQSGPSRAPPDPQTASVTYARTVRLLL